MSTTTPTTPTPSSLIGPLNQALSLAQGALAFAQGTQTPAALSANQQVGAIVYGGAQQIAMLAATGQNVLPASGALVALSTTPPGGLAALLPSPILTIPQADPQPGTPANPIAALQEAIGAIEFVLPRLAASPAAPSASGIPSVDQILQAEASADQAAELSAELQIVQVSLTDLLAFACTPQQVSSGSAPVSTAPPPPPPPANPPAPPSGS